MSFSLKNSGKIFSNLRVSLIINENLPLKAIAILWNIFDSLIEEKVYNSTGRANSYQIPESLINSFISNFNDIHDIYNDPSMYGPPREIKLSLEWQI